MRKHSIRRRWKTPTRTTKLFSIKNNFDQLAIWTILEIESGRMWLMHAIFTFPFPFFLLGAIAIFVRNK